MTQAQLDRAVARATGEPISNVVRRGFSLADPIRVRYDPEPQHRPKKTNHRRRPR